MVKEACVENVGEAILAQENGADRIELCENLMVGGTTPSYGTIKYCVNNLQIPVMVMIRPRGGDFVYSSTELEIMKEDIRVCKSLDCYGVVFGLLTKDSKIDVEKTKELRELAYPMQVTFHKAFDLVPDPYEELEKLVACGVDRILTSGTKATAEEGVDVLRKLNSIAGDRIKIIVAGKVTKENVEILKAQINCEEFHGRKIV